MSTTPDVAQPAPHVQAPTAEIVVNTTTPLGWVDVSVASAIVAAAVYYLYRKLWRRRGQCAGCTSQGKTGCAANKVDPPRAP